MSNRKGNKSCNLLISTHQIGWQDGWMFLIINFNFIIFWVFFVCNKVRWAIVTLINCFFFKWHFADNIGWRDGHLMPNVINRFIAQLCIMNSSMVVKSMAGQTKIMCANLLICHQGTNTGETYLMTICTLTLFLLSQTVFRPTATPYVNLSNGVFIAWDYFNCCKASRVTLPSRIQTCYIFFYFRSLPVIFLIDNFLRAHHIDM